MIQLTLTLKMTTVQVVETSVTVNNSPIQDYVHPDDQTQPTFHFLYVYMWLKIIWHSRLPFSVVVGVSLIDLKWVGFSGSGTGWGIRLYLSRVFLSCDTRWSFYFYTSGTFCPILGLFTLCALHQFFHHIFYHAEYCFLTPHDAVDRRKETISLVCFFFFFFFFFAFCNAFH